MNALDLADQFDRAAMNLQFAAQEMRKAALHARAGNLVAAEAALSNACQGFDLAGAVLCPATDVVDAEAADGIDVTELRCIGCGHMASVGRECCSNCGSRSAPVWVNPHPPAEAV